MVNAWLDHLKSVWSRVKGTMSYKEAMNEAKKTYQASASGSPSASSPTKKARRGKKKGAKKMGGTRKGGRR